MRYLVLYNTSYLRSNMNIFIFWGITPNFNIKSSFFN